MKDLGHKKGTEMFTQIHSKPSVMEYHDEIRMESFIIEPTLPVREWDRTRWAYVHPVTGEVIRTVCTFK